MTPDGVLDADARARILEWAAGRHEAAVLSLQSNGEWVVFPSRFVSADADRGRVELAYPREDAGQAPPEITPLDPLGVSFRRGHKKCSFSTSVLERRTEPDGEPVLVVQMPTEMHEFQRRVFQRVAVPLSRSLHATIQPTGTQSTRPADARSDAKLVGVVKNVSASGMLVAIGAEHATVLRLGDRALLMACLSRGTEADRLEAVVRHVTVLPPNHVGFGFQFLGLEATRKGCESLQRLASLVEELRRPPTGGSHHWRNPTRTGRVAGGN